VPASLILPYSWMIQLMTMATVIAPVLALCVTVWLLQHGVRQARYFLAAFTGLLLGSVLTSLHMFNLVPASMWTEYGLQIGSLLEFTLLSFALAHRLKLAYEDNERLQRAHAADLEARVLARTQDLDVTLLQLTETNQRLQALTEQDALTGLKNRMFLAGQLGETWRHALRHGEPLTALMIDIDNFKRINDEHGHMAGDEALRQVAHLIDQVAQRPGDHAVRYGGEEFLVLLPNTHLAGAAHVAESIRRKVEALTVRSADKAIPLTVSIGVACVHATSEGSPQALITAADRLLYQAKQNGRNQCALHPDARIMSPALSPLLRPAAKPATASSQQA
jgi:diguanylate cyclase (GGDEF)-like protein